MSPGEDVCGKVTQVELTGCAERPRELAGGTVGVG